jgi:hypothetical protein
VYAMRFGHQPEQTPIAAETPHAPGVYNLQRGLVVPVQELRARLAVGTFVDQLNGMCAVPLHVDDGHRLMRNDSLNLCPVFQVFQPDHPMSSLQPASLSIIT